jgi:hypothetical protein
MSSATIPQRGNHLRSLLRRWPFMLLGLATLGLFVLVEQLGGRPPEIVAVVLRVLIVPGYLANLFGAWMGMGRLPEPLLPWIAAPLFLLPYLAADLGRHYWRHLMDK